MNGKSGIVRRRPQRLNGFDYALGYAYFITVCIENRLNLFGEVGSNGKIVLTPAGEMVESVWLAMPEYNPGLVLDEFVVMPDHFHAILGFVDPGFWSGQCRSATVLPSDEMQPNGRVRPDLPSIVRNFKSLTTRMYGNGVRQQGWKPYKNHLWQRSYWDRILRNEKDLQAHREYIYTNPLCVILDSDPSNQSPTRH